jgi:hypothetical protein
LYVCIYRYWSVTALRSFRRDVPKLKQRGRQLVNNNYVKFNAQKPVRIHLLLHVKVCLAVTASLWRTHHHHHPNRNWRSSRLDLISISSTDDEVKKETGASSRRLSKNKTDRVRAAEFFEFLSKFPIVALERCPSHLPVDVHVNKVVEKAADDEERIINLPG